MISDIAVISVCFFRAVEMLVLWVLIVGTDPVLKPLSDFVCMLFLFYFYLVCLDLIKQIYHVLVPARPY